MIERALRGLARGVTARPGGTAALLLLVTAGAALLLPRFAIDPDVSSLLPEDSEAVELFAATHLGERAGRTLFLSVRGEDLNERMSGLLALLAESEYLVEVAGTPEDLAGARHAAYRAAPLHFVPEGTLDALEERLAGSGRRAAVLESRALLAEDPLLGREVVKTDPLGLRWLLAESTRGAVPEAFDPESPYLLLADGSQAFVRLVGAHDPFDVEYSEALLADVESRLEGFEATLLGGYATARADAGRIRSDLTSSLLFSVPAILLFLAISTRSFVVPHLVLTPVMLAVVWALGYGGVLLGPLTPLAVSAAAILVGLGVDFTIHYVGRFESERATASYGTALERAHVHTGRALLAGMATTVIAFLSFGLGAFRGLRGFGFLLAVGLVFAFVLTLTFLPILLRRVGPRAARPPGIVLAGARRVTRSAAAPAVAYGLLGLAAAAWVVTLTRGLTFDADPTRMRPADADLTLAASELEADLGFSPVAVLVLAPADLDPGELAAAVTRLAEEDHVTFGDGPQDLAPGADRAARVAAFRERTANWVEDALADFEAAGFKSAALRPALEEQAALLLANPAGDANAYRVEWRGESYWRVALHPTRSLTDPVLRAGFHAAVARAFPAGVRVVDPFGLADELGPLLAADLRRAVGVCAVLVVLLVILSVGCVGLGIAALLPVLCGLGISLGVLALFELPLHPGNFVAVPLILGLGVDDGVHMVLRYKERGADAILSTGLAVWRTSVTTALAFGSLITASSPAIASLGAIALLGTLVCFLATVLIVPTLLERTHGQVPPAA